MNDAIVRAHTAFSTFKELCAAMDQGYKPTVSKSRDARLLRLINQHGYTAFIVP